MGIQHGIGVNTGIMHTGKHKHGRWAQDSEVKSTAKPGQIIYMFESEYRVRKPSV